MSRVPFKLVGRYLTRHPIRSFLTVASIAVAVFLLCLLRTLVVALDAGVQASRGDRAYVQSAVSLFVDLPESYETKIRGVEGVANSCKWCWFGGVYQEPQNFFAQFAVQPEEMLDIYPEMEIIAGSKEAFYRERTGCIIGYRLAEKYGFQIGQNIPLLGTIYPRLDGAPWEFNVAAIYRANSASVDDNTMYFHHEYLKQAIEQGASGGPDGIGVYVIKVKDDADPVAVMSRIDALFENGPQRVQTTSEDEFQRQFVSMLGNIPVFLSAIGSAVFIAILLAVLNSMLMAAREQTHDVGILKALGFPDGSVFWVMLLQSLLICSIGGGLGIAAAYLSEEPLIATLGTQFPGYRIVPQTLLLAAAATLIIGLLGGLTPAWSRSRMACVTSLRTEG